jgi:hypothetical protein
MGEKIDANILESKKCHPNGEFLHFVSISPNT